MELSSQYLPTLAQTGLQLQLPVMPAMPAMSSLATPLGDVMPAFNFTDLQLLDVGYIANFTNLTAALPSVAAVVDRLPALAAPIASPAVAKTGGIVFIEHSEHRACLWC